MCKGIEDIKRDAWNEATEIATIRTREETRKEEAVRYGRIIDDNTAAFVDFLISEGYSKEDARSKVEAVLSRNNSDYSA